MKPSDFPRDPKFRDPAPWLPKRPHHMAVTEAWFRFDADAARAPTSVAVASA